MILYNVTIKVDWSIHREWLQWMKDVHMPDMVATGFFLKYRLVKLLMTDDSDGPTYATQYLVESIEKYNEFVEKELGSQSQKEVNKWSNAFVSFSTIMEVVQ